MSKGSAIQLFKNTLRPVYYGCVAWAILWQCNIDWPTLKDSHNLLGAALSFAAIVIGFIGTAMAIMLGLENDLIKKLIKIGYEQELIRTYKLSLYLAFSFCIINVVGFFEVSFWSWPIWSGIGFAMLCSFRGLFSLLFKLIQHRA